MSKIIKYLNFYKHSFSLAFSSWFADRLNFFLFFIGTIIFDLFSPIFGYLVYSNNLSFPGWNFYSFILLTGSFVLIDGIEHITTGEFLWRLQDEVIAGDFDRTLTRPMNPLAFLILNTPGIAGLASLVVGIFIVGFSMLHLQFTLLSLGLYLFVLLLAWIFLSSLNFFTAGLCVWLVQSHSVVDLFREIRFFGKYPISIYGPVGKLIFTFLFPIGLASFYPAEAIVRTISPILLIELVIVCAIFLLSSLAFWRYALKRYSSAGG